MRLNNTTHVHLAELLLTAEPFKSRMRPASNDKAGGKSGPVVSLGPPLHDNDYAKNNVR